MKPRHLALSIAFVVTAVASSCSSFPKFPGFSKKENDSLARVDDLLTHVEQVQAESLLAKERSHAALDSLMAMIAPSFQGDAVSAHAALTASIDQSKQQASKLGASIAPMKDLADSVFAAWTTSLEQYGNSQLRMQSQTRMEETRARYETVLKHAVSAQIAYDAFNGDMRDYALFLEHDFNSGAVAMISSQVDGLRGRTLELDRRLDTCVAATHEYVASCALRGQLAMPSAEARPTAQPRMVAQQPAPQPPAETTTAAPTQADAAGVPSPQVPR